MAVARTGHRKEFWGFRKTDRGSAVMQAAFWICLVPLDVGIYHTKIQHNFLGNRRLPAPWDLRGGWSFKELEHGMSLGDKKIGRDRGCS